MVAQTTDEFGIVGDNEQAVEFQPEEILVLAGGAGEDGKFLAGNVVALVRWVTILIGGFPELANALNEVMEDHSNGEMQHNDNLKLHDFNSVLGEVLAGVDWKQANSNDAEKHEAESDDEESVGGD